MLSRVHEGSVLVLNGVAQTLNEFDNLVIELLEGFVNIEVRHVLQDDERWPVGLHIVQTVVEQRATSVLCTK